MAYANPYQIYQYSRDMYRSTPPAMAYTFLLLYVCFSIFMGRVCIDEYHHQIYLRDHGTLATATIINKHDSGSRNRSYYVDYTFSPLPAEPHANLLTSLNHEVSSDDYRTFSVGDQVRIKYNPRDHNDSHLGTLNMSNAGLARAELGDFIYISVMYTAIFMIFWLIAGWAYRKIKGTEPASLPTPASHLQPFNFGSEAPPPVHHHLQPPLNM